MLNGGPLITPLPQQTFHRMRPKSKPHYSPCEMNLDGGEGGANKLC